MAWFYILDMSCKDCKSICHKIAYSAMKINKRSQIKIDDARKSINELHDQHVLAMTPTQHKKRELNKEHRCGAGQIPSEGQVRTSHNSKVLERGKLCVPWLVRVLGLL